MAVLLLALSVAAPPRAHAHAALVSSEPAAGEQVTAVPTEVVLRFNEQIAAGLALVTVTDGEGVAMTTGSVQVAGDTVTQPLQPRLAAGNYVVRFKVTSADGHPISDAFSFTIPDEVAAAGQDPATATASSSARTTSSPATTPSPSPTTTGAAQAGASSTSGASAQVSDRAMTITTLWLILILAVLALATTFAIIARRGRKARGVHGGHGRFD